MSHSPDRDRKSTNTYLAGWRASGQLLREGRSWSGRERHCAFLNHGDDAARFTDVSAVSGLDFSEDGRALAVVDWDHDGDLDLWFANRTAPRLRLMINQLRGEDSRFQEGEDREERHGFVAFRLRGTTCNRDAVGASVTLIPNDAPANRKYIASLRAGEGFLSQSSKWIHFGLGNRTVDAVEVRWPDGPVERFDSVEPGHRYLLVQGAGTAEPWRAPGSDANGRRTVHLPPSTQVVAPPTDAARVWTPAPIPMPALHYRGLKNGAVTPVQTADKPLLLNLWASWCLPCLGELKEIAEAEETVRQSGVDVLALSVDGLDPAHDTDGDDAKQVIGRMGFPFASGLATSELLEKLERINRFLFDRAPKSAVPTSLLLDRRGALAVIYRGRVDLGQLAEDVKRLAGPDTRRRSWSAPFAGSWFAPMGSLELTALADLFAPDHPADEARYLALLLDTRGNDPQLHYRLGRTWGRLDRRPPALRHLRHALRLAPDTIPALNDLAWHLATGPSPGEAERQEAVRAAEHAAKLTRHRHPGILDTLAAAYAAAGHFEEAATSAEKAVLLYTKANRADMAETIKRRLALYRASKRYRENAMPTGDE